MSDDTRVIRKLDYGPDRDCYVFFCPGCKHGHYVQTRGPAGEATWSWNGDLQKPTFSPSILTWSADSRCHSYVREGQIEFLNDCTHSLAGTTVPLEPF